MERDTCSHPAGFYPAYVAAADFNGDGKPDLVIVSGGGTLPGTFSFLEGNGDGTFESPVASGFSMLASPMNVADLNGDGIPDVAQIDLFTIAIFTGNGDGTFTNSGLTFLAGDYPSFMVAADFNRDGKTDIAVTNSQSNDITLLTNSGAGTLPAAASQAALVAAR
ncbi:MAG: FG-GAP repeat domain-containing protein [Bryobacteraceae bacterium]